MSNASSAPLDADLADDPSRFADLVPDVREYLREAIPALPAPTRRRTTTATTGTATCCSIPRRARRGRSSTGRTSRRPTPRTTSRRSKPRSSRRTASRGDPADALREAFRTSYAETREGWAFDESTRERMRLYRLTDRLDAMACLPLWYQDATPEERDERAAEHRAFVARYV